MSDAVDAAVKLSLYGCDEGEKGVTFPCILRCFTSRFCLELVVFDARVGKVINKVGKPKFFISKQDTI